MEVPEGYVERDEGRCVLRAEALATLEHAGLTRLDEVFEHEGEVRGRYKSLARLRDPEGAPLFVKRYDFHRGEVFLRGALKLNPPVYSGPRELGNLLAMAAAGLRVPVPLAAGEEDRGSRRRSFVVLAELRGTSLETLGEPSDEASRRARLEAIADLVRRLHRAGFWHRDLYACNLFASGPSTKDALPLGLLDCERVGHREGGPRQRWRVKDLAALRYSFPWIREPEWRELLARYLEDPADLPRWERVVAKKAKRLASHGKKGP